MQSSLGIFIEKNIIKYAKLQKDKELIKIEAYNVAFYDNDLEEVLNRIINETYSYKVPISINLSDEIYNTFEISSLLNKQDRKKAIEIEYEMLCNEKGYNKNSLEHKYLIVDPKGDYEKDKIINIMANKNEISKRISLFGNKKISTITPISTSNANLIDIDGRENVIIVDIENKTKLTTIIDGQISQIDVFDEGMGEILDEINKTENSFSKSYEVCKNITVYTQNSPEFYSETNEYMGIISSTLSKIAIKTRDIISTFFSNIDKIYISGLGTSINNIDLYFQEYIPSARCEMLKPYFLKDLTGQVSIKEYIEVNSAIALALNGLGLGNKTLNFSKGATISNNSGLNQEINLGSFKELLTKLKDAIIKDFSEPLHSFEKLLIRGMIACVIAIIIYTGLSKTIFDKMNKKSVEISEASKLAQAEISKASADISTISSKTRNYASMIEKIKNPEVTEDTLVRIIPKDAIPNFLNRLMFIIPKSVKLTSIENSPAVDTTMVIKAESEKYEQLGYFKAAITTSGILKDVESTTTDKGGKTIEVRIEGKLP